MLFLECIAPDLHVIPILSYYGSLVWAHTPLEISVKLYTFLETCWPCFHGKQSQPLVIPPMGWVWKFSGTTQRNITTKQTAFKTSWILIRICTIFSKYDLELVDTVVSWNECNLKILSPPIKLLSLYSTFLELFRIKNGDQYSAF